MRWGLWLFGASALASLIWGACAQRTADRATTTRDSALAMSAVKDSVAVSTARAADSALTVAGRALSASRGLQRTADSLKALIRRAPPVDRPDTTVRDSLRFWRDSAQKAQGTSEAALRLAETLQGSLDTLTVAFEAQREAANRFRLAYETEKSRADGLAQTLRKMPSACPKVLGLFPRPRIGPQFGVIGRQLDFGVQIPLGC